MKPGISSRQLMHTQADLKDTDAAKGLLPRSYSTFSLLYLAGQEEDGMR
jgi:hypothetical protein